METLKSQVREEKAHASLSRALTDARCVGEFELKLTDSIEMNPEDLRERLAAAGKRLSATPDFIEHIKLALLYHEAAVKTAPEGMIAIEYALQSYAILTTLKAHSLLPEAAPLIYTYEASSSALIAIQRAHFKGIRQSLRLLRQASSLYSEISLLPHFLSARIALHLPWYYLRKKRRAMKDFESVIKNNKVLNTGLNARLTSFAFFELAKILASRRQYYEVIEWLAKADALDAGRTAAGEVAEKMRTELFEKHLKIGDNKTKR